MRFFPNQVSVDLNCNLHISLSLTGKTQLLMNLPEITSASSSVSLPAAVPRIFGNLDLDTPSHHVAAIKLVNGVIGITKKLFPLILAIILISEHRSDFE